MRASFGSGGLSWPGGPSLTAVQNLRFIALMAAREKPDYFYSFSIRYRAAEGGEGVIGADTRSARKAVGWFNQQIPGAQILEMRFIDFDHNSLSANNWLEGTDD